MRGYHPVFILKYETRFRARGFFKKSKGESNMMYFFIFIGVIVLYFGIRIWIGSRKMEFYGDSLKNHSRNSRDEAYEKSAQHATQLKNNHKQGGGPV
jgi:hypothetical protein